jgi:glycerol-3-phosphate O-acyltransferase
MDRIREAVPVLPVPLVAAAMFQAGAAAASELTAEGAPHPPVSRAALAATAHRLVEALRDKGAHQHLPEGDAAAAIDEGLAMLALRGILELRGGEVRVAPGEEATVGYYAASVLQRLAEPMPENGVVGASLELPPAEAT